MNWNAGLSRRGVVGAGAATLLMPSGVARAEDWPARPVTIVVPFTAGGTTDLFGRIFAQAMQEKYGKPFLVENKAGAGGTVGASAVAKAPPDGHTLLVGTASTHAIAPYVYKRTGYDAEADFQPVSLFATLPNLLVVSPKMPVKTFAEFVDYLKANSGKLSYGSSGVGASNHLPGEMIQNLTGTKMTHVPYRSSNDIMNALAGGHVDLAFDNMTLAWPQAQGGTVRALAVTSKERSPTAPDVPAIAETFPSFRHLDLARAVRAGQDGEAYHRHARGRGEAHLRDRRREEEALRHRCGPIAQHARGLRGARQGRSGEIQGDRAAGGAVTAVAFTGHSEARAARTRNPRLATPGDRFQIGVASIGSGFRFAAPE